MASFFLRVFTEVASPGEAEVVASNLRRVLSGVGAFELLGTRPYWKIEGYHEVTLRAAVDVDPATLMPRVLALLGEGWVGQHTETEAMWNPGTGASFVEPTVRWAHVEALE